MSPLADAVRALSAREVSSEELTRACLGAIASREGEINAFVTVTEDAALKAARESDARRSAGAARHPMDGIPFAMKDNICTKGVRTTCASRMLSEFVPPYDAAVSERLASLGCVLVGKTNMDEFAMGGSSETSYFGPVSNPRDIARVAGGSSGGSAAAVAAGMCLFALGSDTGGSVRLPASFCGVSGLKPTYGAVSRRGLVAFASSFDQIGPICAGADGLREVFRAIEFRDHLDATSASRPDEFAIGAERLYAGDRPLRAALPDELFAGSEPGVERAVLGYAEKLRESGAVVERVSMPELRLALDAYYVISSAEASSNLARYDGFHNGRRAQGEFASHAELVERSRAEGFGREVKRRIEIGSFALSSGHYREYYASACEARRRVSECFDRMFARYDLTLSPVSPVAAYRKGEYSGNPEAMCALDLCAVPASIAGLPAASAPCGTSDGLPVGAQLIAPRWREDVIFRAMECAERIYNEENSERG